MIINISWNNTSYSVNDNDDIDTSDGECSDSEEAEEEEGKQNTVRTVTTSLMDVLQRVKDEEGQSGDSQDPLNYNVSKPDPGPPASIGAARYVREISSWLVFAIP